MSRIRRTVVAFPHVLVLALSLVCPPVILGQAAARDGAESQLILTAAARGPLREAVARDTANTLERRIRPTHWKTGALIGGVSLGLGLAVLLTEFCEHSESNRGCSGIFVGGALLGGLTGGIIGGLIGGQFPKHDGSGEEDATE